MTSVREYKSKAVANLYKESNNDNMIELLDRFYKQYEKSDDEKLQPFLQFCKDFKKGKATISFYGQLMKYGWSKLVKKGNKEVIEYVKDVMSAKYVLVKLPDPDNKDNILTLKCLQAKNSSSSPISIYRLVNSVVMNFPSNKKLSKEEIDKKIGKGDGDVNVDECIKRLSYEFDGNQYAFNEIVMPIKLEGMRLGTSHVKNAIVPSKSHVGSKVGPTKSSVPSDSEPEDFAQSDRNKIEKPQRQKRKVEEDTESKSKKPRSTPAMRKQEELIRELEKLRGRDPYDILVEELEPLIKELIKKYNVEIVKSAINHGMHQLCSKIAIAILTGEPIPEMEFIDKSTTIPEKHTHLPVTLHTENSTKMHLPVTSHTENSTKTHLPVTSHTENSTKQTHLPVTSHVENSTKQTHLPVDSHTESGKTMEIDPPNQQVMTVESTSVTDHNDDDAQRVQEEHHQNVDDDEDERTLFGDDDDEEDEEDE